MALEVNPVILSHFALQLQQHYECLSTEVFVAGRRCCYSMTCGIRKAEIFINIYNLMEKPNKEEAAKRSS